jgi:hypothetical protein
MLHGSTEFFAFIMGSLNFIPEVITDLNIRNIRNERSKSYAITKNLVQRLGLGGEVLIPLLVCEVLPLFSARCINL